MLAARTYFTDDSRATRDRIDTAMADTAAKYRPHSRLANGYVRWKFRYDPLYRQIAERAPLRGPLVDYACGRGQTALLLAHLQPEIEVLGIDWAHEKIELSRCAAKEFGKLVFEVGDIRTAPIPRASTILVLDVLHYMTADEQDNVLRRATAALAEDGVLFVRDVDAGLGWRSCVNRWQERIGCSLRMNRGATLCFRRSAELAHVLTSEGLCVRSTPSWDSLPLANVLIEARRT